MLNVAKFQKKPIVVRATRLMPWNVSEVAKWCGGTIVTNERTEEPTGILITTLEGRMLAAIEDWVICGVKGEFYPCKHYVFVESYVATRETEEVNIDDQDPG